MRWLVLFVFLIPFSSPILRSEAQARPLVLHRRERST